MFATGAFVIGLMANLALALSVSQFPFEDVTNNMARYAMLDRAWFGGHWGPLPGYIQAPFVIGPYLGVDVIGAALVHVGGPHFALHAMAALVVCSLPVGFWLLLRVVGRSNLAWSLAGVLIGMGFFTVVGFVNYVIALGAAMAWLAAWWATRGHPSAVQMVVLWLGVLVLYLLHLSAPLLVLVVVWIDVLHQAHAWPLPGAKEVRNSAGSTKDRVASDRLRVTGHYDTRKSPLGGARGAVRSLIPNRRVQFAVGATLVLGIMCVVGGLGTAPAAPHGATVDYPPVMHKLVNLFTPFYVFSFSQATITLIAYGMMAIAFLLVNRHVLARRKDWSVFLLAAGACLALFIIFPAGTAGTGYLDMRWLPGAFLWPFCAAESEARAPPRVVTALMLAGCLLHDAVIGRTVGAIEHELADYHAALMELPSGGRVLPIDADEERHGARVFPYRHYVFWYVIERHGRAPGLFNGNGEGNGRPAHGFLSHFLERDHLYFPGERWGLTEFDPLDWRRIDADYDYIIETGTDPKATRLIAQGARPVNRIGDVTVFAVEGR